MDTLFLYNLLVCYYSLLAHFDFQLQCNSKIYLNEPSCRNQFLLNLFYCLSRMFNVELSKTRHTTVTHKSVNAKSNMHEIYGNGQGTKN